MHIFHCWHFVEIIKEIDKSHGPYNPDKENILEINVSMCCHCGKKVKEIRVYNCRM